MRARLDFTHRDRVARLTLASPKANIVDAGMISELDAACEMLSQRRDIVAVVVGADGPNFSFGASVEEHQPAHIERTLEGLHTLLRRMTELPAPTIAPVRGLCLGGGFELVLACDLLIVEDDAQFALPEIKLGVFPPAGSALLPVRLGVARASALVLTGSGMSGRDARDCGLAARAVPKGTLDIAVQDWLDADFLPRSAAALRVAATAVRADVRRALGAPLHELERLYLDQLMKEPDALEGISAFLEKRPPRWRSAMTQP